MSPTTTSTIKSPRSGCATSLRQATSRPVTSTNATSATCIPTTFVHTPSAISSQASASGPTRFVAPDGPTIDLFGRVPVRANLSPRQAKDLGLMMSGTYQAVEKRLVLTAGALFKRVAYAIGR